MSGVALQFPLPPNRANRRGHWAALRREDKAYQDRAWKYLLLRRHLKPRSPWLACRISAHITTSRPQDLDNATARLKPILDLLVQGRWIVDDNPKVVRGLAVTTEVGTPVGVLLTIVPEAA